MALRSLMWGMCAAAGLVGGAFSWSAAAAQTPSGVMDAEALFQSHCASCHEPNIERAPSRATMALMSPEQIIGALDSGVMAPMAAGLSKADIQALAAHLGGAASAPSTVASASGEPAAPAALDPSAKPVEWLAYHGDYASRNYSPLDQINRDTVKTLHVVWRQSLTPDAPRDSALKPPPPSSNNETTPLMVGGRVYFSTGVGGVAALDAASGKVAWNVDPFIAEDPASADDARRVGGATRALAYWPDGGDGRIIALVGGRYLNAIDARTGKRIADFGVNGQVDLHMDSRAAMHSAGAPGRP